MLLFKKAVTGASPKKNTTPKTTQNAAITPEISQPTTRRVSRPQITTEPSDATAVRTNRPVIPPKLDQPRRYGPGGFGGGHSSGGGATGSW